ncbi:hypothetical protein M8494_14840 [Serratia ureilytica]
MQQSAPPVDTDDIADGIRTAIDQAKQQTKHQISAHRLKSYVKSWGSPLTPS